MENAATNVSRTAARRDPCRFGSAPVACVRVRSRQHRGCALRLEIVRCPTRNCQGHDSNHQHAGRRGQAHDRDEAHGEMVWQLPRPWPTSTCRPARASRLSCAVLAAMICVAHEMGFARAVADRVIFMASGQKLEEGTPSESFQDPKHERTRAFLGDILGHSISPAPRGWRHGVAPVAASRFKPPCSRPESP